MSEKDLNKNAMDKAIAIRARRLLGETPEEDCRPMKEADKILVSAWMDEYAKAYSYRAEHPTNYRSELVS